MKSIVILFSILLLLSLFSLTIGQYSLSIDEIIDFCLFKMGLIELENYQMTQNILMEIRLPRILASILIGASLSISGSAFQSMFKNPLVSPSVLGVLSGASFGAALGLIAFDEFIYVQISSFIFGILAVLIAIFISILHRQAQVILLVLGGVVSSALFS